MTWFTKHINAIFALNVSQHDKLLVSIQWVTSSRHKLLDQILGKPWTVYPMVFKHGLLENPLAIEDLPIYTHSIIIFNIYIYVMRTTFCNGISHYHVWFPWEILQLFRGTCHLQRLGVQRWEHRCFEFHRGPWEIRLKLDISWYIWDLNNRHVIQL